MSERKRFVVKYIKWPDDYGEIHKGYVVRDNKCNYDWCYFAVDIYKRGIGYKKKKAYQLARAECNRLREKDRGCR